MAALWLGAHPTPLLPPPPVEGGGCILCVENKLDIAEKMGGVGKGGCAFRLLGGLGGASQAPPPPSLSLKPSQK